MATQYELSNVTVLIRGPRGRPLRVRRADAFTALDAGERAQLLALIEPR